MTHTDNLTELRRRILADPELTRWLGSLMVAGELVPEVVRLGERLGLPVDEAEVRRHFKVPADPADAKPGAPDHPRR
ncbi:MAG: hypothetical protein AB7D57_12330 [Desulfovibrionaceae bacterium]